MKQATTRFHMAWLFVELFDKVLVKTDSGRPDGNADMLGLLARAVTNPHARSLIRRLFELPTADVESADTIPFPKRGQQIELAF
jgi:hypothetical protein